MQDPVAFTRRAAAYGKGVTLLAENETVVFMYTDENSNLETVETAGDVSAEVSAELVGLGWRKHLVSDVDDEDESWVGLFVGKVAWTFELFV